MFCIFHICLKIVMRMIVRCNWYQSQIIDLLTHIHDNIVVMDTRLELIQFGSWSLRIQFSFIKYWVTHALRASWNIIGHLKCNLFWVYHKLYTIKFHYFLPVFTKALGFPSVNIKLNELNILPTKTFTLIFTFLASTLKLYHWNFTSASKRCIGIICAINDIVVSYVLPHEWISGEKCEYDRFYSNIIFFSG